MDGRTDRAGAGLRGDGGVRPGRSGLGAAARATPALDPAAIPIPAPIPVPAGVPAAQALPRRSRPPPARATPSSAPIPVVAAPAKPKRIAPPPPPLETALSTDPAPTLTPDTAALTAERRRSLRGDRRRGRLADRSRRRSIRIPRGRRSPTCAAAWRSKAISTAPPPKDSIRWLGRRPHRGGQALPGAHGPASRPESSPARR